MTGTRPVRTAREGAGQDCEKGVGQDGESGFTVTGKALRSSPCVITGLGRVTHDFGANHRKSWVTGPGPVMTRGTGTARFQSA
jgi:hypothetical protein